MIQFLVACLTAFGAPATSAPPNAASEAAFLAKVAASSKSYVWTAERISIPRQAKVTLGQPKIPKEVLSDTLEWVRKVLREPYAGSLEKSTWIGYPNAGHTNEALMATEVLDEATVTWSDTGSSITILIDTGLKTIPGDESAREQGLVEAIERYLKVRESPSERISYSATLTPSEKSDLWGGMVSREQARLPDGSFSGPLGWDCHITAIADGRWLLFNMSARDDDDPHFMTESRIYFVGEPRPLPKKSRFDR